MDNVRLFRLLPGSGWTSVGSCLESTMGDQGIILMALILNLMQLNIREINL
jgi:hypothetical protein